MVGGTHVPCGAAQRDVDLVVHCPRPSLQRPVQRPSGQVECARVYEQESALASGDHGRLREADVVADGEANLAVLWQIDDGQLVTGRQDLTLLEPDFPGDVDVEQMRLPMLADQGSRRREDERGVVVLVGGGFQLRNAPSNQVCFGLCCERRQRMECR